METAVTPKPARKKRSLWGSLIFAVCTVMVLVGGLYFFVFGGILFVVWWHSGPGAFDRKNMEAIVEQVRLAKMHPGDEKEFKLDDLSKPKSLHLFEAKHSPAHFESGTGHVSARMSPEGRLTVVIETNDMGHAGSYGFVYSDVPLNPKPHGDSSSWLAVDVPGHLFLMQPDMKIDEHWWKILNNLD